MQSCSLTNQKTLVFYSFKFLNQQSSLRGKATNFLHAWSQNQNIELSTHLFFIINNAG